MGRLDVNAVRSEALFVSPLQRSDDPTGQQVRAEIRRAIRGFGCRGCAARVAEEYGEHPDIAVGRMRWARHVVAAEFSGPPTVRAVLGQPGRRAA